MSTPDRFNIRVYGICIQQGNPPSVLLAEENRFGVQMTKFPGGGLQFGEGLKDALKREWIEEVQLDISVGNLFYINDFLQVSAFKKSDQLLAVYYEIHTDADLNLLAGKPFRVPAHDPDEILWLKLQSITPNLPEMLTFPVDKVVGNLIYERYCV